MKVWSISTTVRNPERITDFCLAIEAIKGKEWHQTTQMEFMYELIRRRFYSPQHMTYEQQNKFDNPEYRLSLKEAKDIFETQSYEDPPMRGRTAIAPLRDIGVVRLANKVELTSIGEALVAGGLSCQDVLLNYCLKWEVPSPGHRLYTVQNGFNIRPFVGSLALISRVNNMWSQRGFEPVGLSREEFDIFAPTLINHVDIDSYAARIVERRRLIRSKKSAGEKQAIGEREFMNHLATCLDSGIVTQIHRNNLRDYGDNTIRYFRHTGFIEYRGAGRYVDLATAVVPQISMLIDHRFFEPIGFAAPHEYFEYVADLNSFTPPWSDKRQMAAIKKHLRAVLKDAGSAADITIPKSSAVVNKVRGEDGEIVELRKALVRLRLDKLKLESRHTTFVSELVKEYDNLIGRSYTGYLPRPVALEFNTFKAFLSLNDAISVTANYPAGDDGEPISTAPGGATDLICEYRNFVLSVEVTLSRGNLQWVMEGQPVQRHLRSIEDDYSKPAYAFFLAPRLHNDTVETFWIANVHGYQGGQQRIAALEIPFWCEYLKAKNAHLINGLYNQDDLQLFLDGALPNQSLHANALAWKQTINSTEFALSFG